MMSRTYDDHESSVYHTICWLLLKERKYAEHDATSSLMPPQPMQFVYRDSSSLLVLDPVSFGGNLHIKCSLQGRSVPCDGDGVDGGDGAFAADMQNGGIPGLLRESAVVDAQFSSQQEGCSFLAVQTCWALSCSQGPEFFSSNAIGISHACAGIDVVGGLFVDGGCEDGDFLSLAIEA
jgi:hypothetical protein